MSKTTGSVGACDGVAGTAGLLWVGPVSALGATSVWQKF